MIVYSWIEGIWSSARGKCQAQENNSENDMAGHNSRPLNMCSRQYQGQNDSQLTYNNQSKCILTLSEISDFLHVSVLSWGLKLWIPLINPTGTFLICWIE